MKSKIKNLKLQASKQTINPRRLNFFSRMREVLGNTQEYFAAVKKEGYWPALKYYLPFLVVGALVNAYTLPESLFLPLSGVIFVVLFVGGLICQPAMLFFMSWIINLCLRMCKGQGSYLDTFKASVYGATPSLLWQVPYGLLALLLNVEQRIWLFFPTIAFLVWSIYLQVVGYAQYHQISKARAFWAGVALPMGIVGVGVFLIVFLGLVLFAGMAG